MKKIISILLSSLLVFSNCLSVSADPEIDTPIDDEIINEYKYTYNINSSLSISGNLATCRSFVMGFSNTATKIIVSQTLQKKNGATWSDIASWNKTFNSWYAIYTTTSPAQGSGTYRLKTVARVYSGADYETITAYSAQFVY